MGRLVFFAENGEKMILQRVSGIFLRTGLGILFLISVVSCVTSEQDILYVNNQIKALDDRVDRMQESMDSKMGEDLDAKLETIRVSEAEAGAEMDRIRTEVQTLSGRVEENSHLLRRTVERDTTEQDMMKANLAELGPRITELEKRVVLLYDYLKLKPPVPEKETPSGEAKEPSLKPPAPDKEPISPEARLYETTLTDYHQGRYEQALAGFEEFLGKYPKSDLADNAQFWIGECYMTMEKYERAILAYQSVIKNYPKGNKVPNAMLRQALAFYELKDKTSARLLLKKVIKQYPGSSEAKIAEAKLKSL
jgi:tol-pal system protein YbgF